jgi:hypothetical protein
MNERVIRVLIAAAASLLVVPAVLAQRRTVDVAFSITRGHLYDNFDAPHMQLIQNMVRLGVATKLSGPKASPTDHGAFPLFDFWAQPGNNHLTIEVDDDPTAVGIEPPVILRLRMNSVARPDDDPLVIVFRTDARNEPAGDAATFAGDVIKAIAQEVDSHRPDWVDKLFREVVVAENASPLPAEKAFVLPFSAAEYEIGERSRFRITAGSNEFEAKARTSGTKLSVCVDHPPEAVKVVQRGQGLRPNKVHFLQYDRVKQPTQQTPASAANLGPGGP